MMKVLAIMAATGLLAITSATWGAPIVFDNFNYTPGSALEGNGGWNLRGPSTGIVVEAGNVPSPAGGVPAAGNSILMHDGTVDGGTGPTVAAIDVGVFDANLSPALYYSMNFRVTSLTGLATTVNGVFITGFNNQDATPTATAPTLFHGRLQIRGEGSGYQLGVSAANATATYPATFDPTIYSVGQDLQVVIKLQMRPGTETGTDESRLDDAYMWINPDPSTFGAASEPAPLLTSEGWRDQFNTVQSFCLRTWDTDPEFTQVDELRIGTTWADVVPLPEPSMGVLAAIGGLALLRRRRRR